MYYEAQANVNNAKYALIKKGRRINKIVYDSLPSRQKKKFKMVLEEKDKKPAGFNEVIGDTPEDKKHREQVEKEDAKTSASKDEPKTEPAKENVSDKNDSDKKEDAKTKEPPQRKK